MRILAVLSVTLGLILAWLAPALFWQVLAGLVAVAALLLAFRHPTVFGARLTGAGFGGACVALVKSGTAVEVSESVLGHYQLRGHIGARLV